MDNDGHGQHTDGREPRAIAKVALAVEVAHGTGDSEVGRNGSDAAHDARSQPVVALQQVEDILGTCKAQSHTGGIDDAIEVLVIIGVIAQKKPQHEQFGAFLGQRGGKQCRRDGSLERAQVVKLHTGHDQERGDDQRDKCRAHAIEEGLVEHPQGLRTKRVFLVNPPAEYHDGNQCGDDDEEHCLLVFSF